MIVDVESYDTSIAEKIRSRLIEEVTRALQSIQTCEGKFIVNDTVWYWRNPAGALRPTVVNSATYISKNFQNALAGMGWEKEPTIDGQNFDALLEFNETSMCFGLREENFIETLSALRSKGFSNYGVEASQIFKQYVQASTPFLPEALVPFASLFEKESKDYNFRVGLEFETGNIASSFRAIEKLQGLYDSRKIDIGVFVTSKNKKDGAARIWPVSNRNGSFVELRQRRYDARRTYPHIDISFLPDGFDHKAKYIGESELYEMRFSGETTDVGGLTYDIAFNSKNEEKLVPRPAPSSELQL